MFQMPANTGRLEPDGSVAQLSAGMTAVEINIQPSIESLHEGLATAKFSAQFAP